MLVSYWQTDAAFKRSKAVQQIGRSTERIMVIDRGTPASPDAFLLWQEGTRAELKENHEFGVVIFVHCSLQVLWKEPGGNTLLYFGEMQ